MSFQLLVLVSLAILSGAVMGALLARLLYSRPPTDAQLKNSSARLPAFTESERIAWAKYQFLCGQARIAYDREISRLHQLHDQGLQERAEQRFVQKKIEQRKLGKRLNTVR